MDRKREMKLPIYIEAAMGVLLVVILAMAGRNGGSGRSGESDGNRQRSAGGNPPSDQNGKSEKAVQ